MKKFLIPILAFVPIGANAACVSATCPSGTSNTNVRYMTSASGSCSNSTTKCLYNSLTGLYLSYDSCIGGCNEDFLVLEAQKLSAESVFETVCGEGATTTTRNICTCGTKCDSCLNNVVAWTSPKTGYQSILEYKCSYATSCGCTSTKKYRCDAGYYGTASYSQLGGYSGCTRCPSSDGVYGICDAGNGNTITSCYIPTTSTLTDGAGSYQYTSNCYYSN